MDKTNVKLHYRGSLLWLIFWIIVFFPVAIVLLFTGSTFVLNQTRYDFQYDGSRFWLCFWVLIFFPVAFLLLFLNGYSLKIDNPNDLPVEKIEKSNKPPTQSP